VANASKDPAHLEYSAAITGTNNVTVRSEQKTLSATMTEGSRTARPVAANPPDTAVRRATRSVASSDEPRFLPPLFLRVTKFGRRGIRLSPPTALGALLGDSRWQSTVRRRHWRTMSLSHIIANYLTNWPTVWRRRCATSNSSATFLREGNHEPTRI